MIDYRIGALWMEGSLSFLEQLCLVSFRDAGHHTVLYHYGALQNVPEGIETRDAAEILPRGEELRHARTGSPALHSDLFRYHLLAREERMIWADTDAYCCKRFETETGHFYGWESETHVNGGVLGLPPDCDTLRELLAFTADPYAIPPWFAPAEQDRLRALKDAGTPVHAGDMPWGVWGPHALTHFLHKTGEIRHALPRHALYPFLFKDRGLMLKRGVPVEDYVKDDTFSIHFYGRRMRKRLVEAEGGVPKRWSLIGKLLVKHGVDPAGAPLPPDRPEEDAEPVLPTTPPAAPPAPLTPVPARASPSSGGIPNLSDLAEKHGSDKGPRKHRYTELYHMLFLPYRERPIVFLEMGLQIGGPEHGGTERETTDLPSVRMWLDYFTEAQIVGLDVSDFSWFQHPRFRFLRCDMDDPAQIAQAAEAAGTPDIVVDDASHASKHQQDAFLALFPRLAPGGLYIIEDLRWQPEVYEAKTPGITKTADLFQSFLRDRRFQHTDAATAAAFDAMAPQISGCFLHQAHFDKTRKDQVLVVHKR